MLESKEFKGFADKVVLFLHNTSKVEGEPYPNLLREKGGNGFPTVSFMDHTGRVLYQQPFKKLDLPELEKSFSRLQSWKALQTLDEGDGRNARALFLMEMDFGMHEFEGAAAQMKKLGDKITAKDKKWLTPKMVELEFLSHLKTIDVANQKTLVAAGAKFVGMMEKDRIPQGDQKTTFWQGALKYAHSKMDVDLFEKVLNRGKKELVGDFRLQRYLKNVEKQLEQMKKAKGSVR